MSAGTDYLEKKIGKAIDYCAAEFDISYAECVGILHLQAHKLANVMLEVTEGRNDDDHDDGEEIYECD